MNDQVKTWTKQAPTRGGLYWMVFPIADVQLSVIPVEIYQGPHSLLMAFGGDNKITTPDRYVDCLWSGPIPKPTAPKITINEFKSIKPGEPVVISF